MTRYLKWSAYIALPSAVLAVLLALIHIAFSASQFTGSQKKSFGFPSQKKGAMLLTVYGTIHGGEYPGSVSRIIRDLEEAKKDANIHGVLLAIDSPGGTVSATKQLYDAILSVRKTKPVVALVEGLAASGGYYAASACSRIVSSEAAGIGSIGVLSMHLEIHRFLQKHGIHAETLKAGRYKDIGSPFRKMTFQERKMHQELLDDFYQLFLKDVSIGRKQKMKKVKSWAEGRMFSAKKALRLKMVDALGGKNKALEEIKKILKLKEDLHIIESPKTFEYYMEKYLSFYAAASHKESYANVLQTPILYLYPQIDFLQKIISFSTFSTLR